MTPQETSDFTLDAMASLAAAPGSAHGVVAKGQSHVCLTSKSPMYGTPLNLFRELDHEFGFQTDVCAVEALALCAHYYTPEVDGLAQEWRGACWMNPPYGKGIEKWVQKAYESSQQGATVVCLLPARVDSRWFHNWVWHKAEIRYPKGRLRFRGFAGRGTAHGHFAPFPCLLAIYRPSASAPNDPSSATAPAAVVERKKDSQ